MEHFESTIRAYQGSLASWNFENSTSYSESFAISRFKKKYERPDPKKDEALADKCWQDFIQFDHQLPSRVTLPSGEWYKARYKLHAWLRGDFSRYPIDFPKGSSFNATKGFNSIESRLCRGKWTCTSENFNEFSRVVHGHKALKRAFRKRYTRWYREQNFDLTEQQAQRQLWNAFKGMPNGPFLVFQWKLERITSFVRGSRFSTVPKNNKKRRPINIEPLGNILVQRQQGNFLRDVLLQQGIDLDTLADHHKNRIRDSDVATIDLSNASDSNSVALLEFLLPKKVFKQLSASRSSLLLGADGEYHTLNKMSSMGNGYTFELMTLVLTALCRVLDENATVFGDDIIINKKQAPRLIELLTEVGWVVNEEKSFIDGPFRESCGANYHDVHGYIKSYDFLYPTTIADCANILNKAYALREYHNFGVLYEHLRRQTPKALRGGPFHGTLIETFATLGDHEDIPLYFACESKGQPVSRKRAKKAKKEWCINEVSTFKALRYIPQLASRTVNDLNPNWHWGKYEMYLHAGRISDDIVTGSGSWALEDVYLCDGRVIRRLPK